MKLFPPPPTHPLHDQVVEEAQRFSEQDIATRLWVKEVIEKAPLLMFSRHYGGTGLPISELLRFYFTEYAARMMRGGVWALPSSFNVVEAFLEFSRNFFLFDLREEEEHILQLSDYLDWYTDGRFPETPEVLTDIIPEGIVHSYNFVAPRHDYVVSTSRSSMISLGVAFIRHGSELSSVALMGEKPPRKSDEDAREKQGHGGIAPKGKEWMVPNPKLDVHDRYLIEAPDFSRVVGLTRFDLDRREFVLRQVSVDYGCGFDVYTDDPTVIPSDVAPSERRKILEAAEAGLAGYTSLFAFMASLIYLPAFFVAEQRRVVDSKFATQLKVKKSSSKVRKAVKLLGASHVPFVRTIHCCEVGGRQQSVNERLIEPPKMGFSRKGFWKALPPGEVGEDQDGNAVIGKTWVERIYSWDSRGLDSFVAQRTLTEERGPDPGHIYVLRSGAHVTDYYKVGKTTRTPQERARELSSATGVPSVFEEIGNWPTGHVTQVEQEVHRRLDQYRVRKRREFFSAPLPMIFEVIGAVVAEFDAGGSE